MLRAVGDEVGPGEIAGQFRLEVELRERADSVLDAAENNKNRPFFIRAALRFPVKPGMRGRSSRE